MENWRLPFDQRDSLINICSGVEAPNDVKEDLLKAEQQGENAMKTFVKNRIESSSLSFYESIKRLSLKTFHDMKKKKSVKVKEKIITLAAERNIFGRLLVVVKKSTWLVFEGSFAILIKLYSLGIGTTR